MVGFIVTKAPGAAAARARGDHTRPPVGAGGDPEGGPRRCGGIVSFSQGRGLGLRN